MASVATPQAALDPAVEIAIGDLRARRPRGLVRREWISALVLGGGILLGSVIDFARGTIHMQRVVLSLVSGWYVLGPVAVLGAAGEGPPALANVPLYIGALAAQFATDFASSAAHERLTLGVRP